MRSLLRGLSKLPARVIGGRIQTSEIPIIVEAWATLAIVHWQLRRSGARRLKRQLDSTVQTPLEPASVGNLARLVYLTDLAARYHVREMNCLRRTLALGRVLERRGIPACIHIGTRIEDGKLFGHAWLSAFGEVLNDDPDIARQFIEIPLDKWQGVTQFHE
ncbi:MAG: hypothetical protein ACI8PT_000617 [Gammaproteobacteria bacterium]|jgi:hypothetical protein